VKNCTKFALIPSFHRISANLSKDKSLKTLELATQFEAIRNPMLGFVPVFDGARELLRQTCSSSK